MSWNVTPTILWDDPSNTYNLPPDNGNGTPPQTDDDKENNGQYEMPYDNNRNPLDERLPEQDSNKDPVTLWDEWVPANYPIPSGWGQPNPLPPGPQGEEAPNLPGEWPDNMPCHPGEYDQYGHVCSPGAGLDPDTNEGPAGNNNASQMCSNLPSPLRELCELSMGGGNNPLNPNNNNPLNPNSPNSPLNMDSWGNLLNTAGQNIGGILNTAGQNLSGLLNTAGQQISGVLQTGVDGVNRAFERGMDSFDRSFDRGMDGLERTGDRLLDGIGGAGNRLLDDIRDARQGLQDTLNQGARGLGGMFDNLTSTLPLLLGAGLVGFFVIQQTNKKKQPQVVPPQLQTYVNP